MYLQGRNRDTDIKNGLVGSAREGEEGKNRESSIDVYMLSRVKQIANGKLLYNSGSPPWHSVTT